MSCNKGSQVLTAAFCAAGLLIAGAGGGAACVMARFSAHSPGLRIAVVSAAMAATAVGLALLGFSVGEMTRGELEKTDGGDGEEDRGRETVGACAVCGHPIYPAESGYSENKDAFGQTTVSHPWCAGRAVPSKGGGR